MKTKILWIFAILWMSVIFCFSAQPASDSGKLSMSVSKVILKISKKYNNSDAVAQKKLAKSTEKIMRKAAHIFLFFVLGVIMHLILRQYKLTPAQAFWAAAIFCAVYAATDEVHQLFSSGRACRFIDTVIDTVAATAGGSAVWAMSRVKEKIKLKNGKAD